MSTVVGSPQSTQVIPLDVDVIVVDIDDTLYLERDYVRSGFAAVDRWARSELGIADFAAEAWSAFEAGKRGQIFDEALRWCGWKPDSSVVAEMVERYRSHTPTIALMPDARSALDHWVQTAALAAVTDGPLASQRAKATALALESWVPLIVFTATLGPDMGKPHPAAFELVQERIGVEGRRCVYIADNPHKDFKAPKRLGWRTVRVRRRQGLHENVASGNDVEYEISSFAQLDHVSRGPVFEEGWEAI